MNDRNSNEFENRLRSTLREERDLVTNRMRNGVAGSGAAGRGAGSGAAIDNRAPGWNGIAWRKLLVPVAALSLALTAVVVFNVNRTSTEDSQRVAVQPEITSTPTPLSTATPTPIVVATPGPEPTPLPAVVIQPTTPPETPTEPTATTEPDPSVEPTATPEPDATAEPTATGEAAPTVEPTATAEADPTAEPDPPVELTPEPAAAPSATATSIPAAEPTTVPTAEPTTVPTAEPTTVPTAEPQLAIPEISRSRTFSYVLTADDAASFIPTFDAPGGNPAPVVYTYSDGTKSEFSIMSPTFFGNSVVLQVVRGAPGDDWAEVLLPVRPHGVTAWVQTALFTWSSTDVRVTVALSARTLEVVHGGSVVLTAPIGIGTSDKPTPLMDIGYIDEIVDMGESSSGRYIISLSLFVDSVRDFNGGLPKVAIRGSADFEAHAERGTAGAIIVDVPVLDQLHGLIAPGTIVEIVP